VHTASQQPRHRLPAWLTGGVVGGHGQQLVAGHDASLQPVDLLEVCAQRGGGRLALVGGCGLVKHVGVAVGEGEEVHGVGGHAELLKLVGPEAALEGNVVDAQGGLRGRAG
jgi:hypothetical protein